MCICALYLRDQSDVSLGVYRLFCSKRNNNKHLFCAFVHLKSMKIRSFQCTLNEHTRHVLSAYPNHPSIHTHTHAHTHTHTHGHSHVCYVLLTVRTSRSSKRPRPLALPTVRAEPNQQMREKRKVQGISRGSISIKLIKQACT